MVDLSAFKDGIVIPIRADATGLKTGLADADTALNTTEGKFSKFSSGLQEHGVAIGAAMTAAGAAIITLTDSAREMNADLATSGLQLGVTTEDMRDLALETTNVTFPLEEVTSTFDLLTRAGMDSTDEIQKTATAFDTLGDATGNAASDVTKTLIPAFNAFDIPLENAGDHTDTLTHLFRNTTIEMSDYASVINYLSADLDTLDMSMTDSAAILEIMADKGIQGSAATREFRTAVTSADGDVNALYEALGITADEVAAYAGEIEGADGITQDFADAQNTQYGTMDKLKQIYEEFSLSAGSALEPLEGLGAALAAGGPLILGLSTMPSLLGGVNTAMTFLSANPIVLVIAGLVALLVILQLKFDIIGKAADLLGKGFEWLSGMVSDLIDWFTEAVDWSDVLGTAFDILLGPIGWVQLAMDAFGISWDDVWQGMLDIADSVSSTLEGVWDGITDVADDTVSVLEGIWSWTPLGMITSHWDEISGFLSGAWDSISETAGGALDTLSETFSDTWAGITGITDEFKAGLTTTVTDAVDSVMEITAPFVDQLPEDYQSMWADIGSGAKKFLTGDYEGAFEDLVSIATTYTDMVYETFDDIRGKIVGVFDRLKSTVLDIWGDIKSGIYSVVNRIIDGINVMVEGMNNLQFDVPDWVPGIGGETFGFDIDTLPHLAGGGIVTEPTLAVVGESGPEAVVPLTGSNAGVGGVTIHVESMNVRDDQDIRKIATQLYSIIDRKNGARGIR